MTNQHPITSPPELVHQWAEMLSHRSDHDVFTLAAQWGANRELDACCEWFICDWTDIETAVKLRTARRPKPPTLKEQALEALEVEDDAMPLRSLERSERFDTIRRALEALPND